MKAQNNKVTQSDYDYISLGLDNPFYTSREAQYFASQIKENGHVCFDKYRVYNSRLAAFFHLDSVPVTLVTREKTETTQRLIKEDVVTKEKAYDFDHRLISPAAEVPSRVSGRDYLPSYKEGYDKGVDWFKENYGVSNDTLYGPNAKAYFENLHDLWFHEAASTASGLLGQKAFYAVMLSEVTIKERGYYAGMISQIEQLAENHKTLFRDFFNCPHIEAGDVDDDTSANGTAYNVTSELEDPNASDRIAIYLEPDANDNKLSTLEQCFDHTSKYATIMALLVDKGFCQVGTYMWLLSNKGDVAVLIKYLQSMGFFKNNRRLLSEEIVLIAQNTFGIAISKSTAAHAKPPTGHTHSFNFIRSATTY